MKYSEIHNMVADIRISDKEDLTFQSAVIILYGVTNDTVSKNKIKKATGYFYSTIDFIFHNFYANEIIKEYQWNIGDITDPETGFMELLLCSMAGSGDIVRSDENGKLPGVDEKPISWKDLYNSDYPAKEIELIKEQAEEEIILIFDDPVEPLPEKEPPMTEEKLLTLQQESKNRRAIKEKIVTYPLPVLYVQVIPFMSFPIEKRISNIGRPKKLPPAPKPEKKILRYFKEPPVEPDEKKPIVRPPAIYSNHSPYGIADEVLRGK